MDKKKMLLSLKADYEKMLNNNELEVIELKRYDGRKSGIGNPVIKKLVLNTLLTEIGRQLSEL